LETLAERGVRARAMRSPFNDRLSRCIVLVEENGQRTKINEPFPLDSKDLIANLPTGRIRRRSHLHFEGYHAEAMLPVVGALRNSGWTLSTHDTGLTDRFRSPQGFRDLISSLDVAFINRRTASRILGQSLPSERLTVAMAAFLTVGPRSGCEVVLTLGMDGAAVFPADDPAQTVRVAAPTVTVVDGTGAGDCFVGSYLAQWLRDADPGEAAARACICASLVMTAPGAQGRRTSFADTDCRIAEPIA
jgi:sugar/nucleoside kinase (ribokinase family)